MAPLIEDSAKVKTKASSMSVQETSTKMSISSQVCYDKTSDSEEESEDSLVLSEPNQLDSMESQLTNNTIGFNSNHQTTRVVNADDYSSQTETNKAVETFTSRRSFDASAFRSKGSNSSPVTAALSSSRRQNTNVVSMSHLLSFEVGNALPCMGMQADSGVNGSSHSGRRHSRSGNHTSSSSRSVFSRERFLHANFRFIARHDRPIVDASTATAAVHCQNTDLPIDVRGSDLISYYQRDPDLALPWEQVELVIVPTSEEAICPICLDIPQVPRLTKCGHFFCWPCMLRYAASTESSRTNRDGAAPAVATGRYNHGQLTGNWRKCPICFDIINMKNLKSVCFVPTVELLQPSKNSSGSSMHLVLLAGLAGRFPLMPLHSSSNSRRNYQSMSLMESNNPTSLADLCPFEKITWVDRSFVIDSIVLDEISMLQAMLLNARSIQEDAEECVFIQTALAQATDRHVALLSEDSTDHLKASLSDPVLISPLRQQQQNANLASLSTPTTLQPDLFVHQSWDGQPYFLCPLNIRMLKSQFLEYHLFPEQIHVPLLETEMLVMTEDLRKRHRQLAHLPLGCQFALCEVDLSQLLDRSIMASYSSELEKRASARRGKARREDRAERASRQRSAAASAMMQSSSSAMDSSISTLPITIPSVFMSSNINGSGSHRAADPGVPVGLFASASVISRCNASDQTASMSINPRFSSPPIISTSSKASNDQLSTSFASIAAKGAPVNVYSSSTVYSFTSTPCSLQATAAEHMTAISSAHAFSFKDSKQSKKMTSSGSSSNTKNGTSPTLSYAAASTTISSHSNTMTSWGIENAPYGSSLPSTFQLSLEDLTLESSSHRRTCSNMMTVSSPTASVSESLTSSTDGSLEPEALSSPSITDDDFHRWDEYEQHIQRAIDQSPPSSRRKQQHSAAVQSSNQHQQQQQASSGRRILFSNSIHRH